MRIKALSLRLRYCCIRPFVWAAICPVLKTAAWRKIYLSVKPIQITALSACRTCASLCMCMHYCGHMLKQTPSPAYARITVLFGDLINANFWRCIEIITAHWPSVGATPMFKATVSVAVNHTILQVFCVTVVHSDLVCQNSLSHQETEKNIWFMILWHFRAAFPTIDNCHCHFIHPSDIGNIIYQC